MGLLEWLGALPALSSLNKYRIDRALGQRHHEGNEVLHQVRTPGTRLHEAQRLVVAWIDETHKYLALNVPDRASIFLEDFETIKSEWQRRQTDRTMQRMDKVIEDIDASLSDPIGKYQQSMKDEPALVMREKLERLEEIIER